MWDHMATGRIVSGRPWPISAGKATSLRTSAAVFAEQLSKQYSDNLALDSLDLEIPLGEVFGLLGHNGAGKTTTIRLLTGLISPTSGTSHVLGLESISKGSEIRARTGVLTENPALDSRLTGRENLIYYADFFGIEPSRAARRIDFLIDAFDLNDRDHERVGTYSKGMHQRLALARAMLHEPEVLLLDEPTSGLDPVASRVVHLMINAFRSDGGSVLLCTHNLEEAERLCDRVAVLEHGRLIATGKPKDLTSRISEQQVEIEIAPGHDSAARCAALKVVPGAVIAVTGNLLRVEGIPRERIPELVDALAAEGVRVYRVSPRVASLEDVYFALLDGGGHR
jgi:ABC-2 type transport system ATP-binding protein